MKKLTILLSVMLTAVVMSGCSLQSRVGSAANTLVTEYCTKPAADRAVIRLWIDNATTPNQIRVNCAADLVNGTQTPPTTELKNE